MKNYFNSAIVAKDRLVVCFLLLALVSLVAYVNAWTYALVFDDKFFVGSSRFSGWEEVLYFFTEDLWAANGTQSELYRPVLLISLFLDSRLFGDWVPGYHLSNIVLHVLATLLVFGLVRQLLNMSSVTDTSSDLYALLGTLVFAVHPVHTEAVNSIFNRSEMLAAIGMSAGIWWFLHHLGTKPARAWAGLALAYLFALMAKESAVVLPVLAVVLVLVLTPGSLMLRLRKCFPVLWLLIPLSVYLVLRAEALAPPEPAGIVETTVVSAESQSEGSQASDSQSNRSFRNVSQLFARSQLPDADKLLESAGFMSRGLGAMVWPYPQRVYYSQLSRHLVWTASLLQLLLVAIALHQWRRGRCGLVIGLAFFYIGLLPVTRFLGFFDGIPPLAERFLYFPSVSLAFLAAIGLRFIARRYGMMIAVAPVLVVSIVFTPLCWTRNAEWADEVVLFEAEYRRGVRGSRLLEGLTSALMTQGKHDRVKEICGLHLEEFGPQEEYGRRRGKFALGCAEMLTRQRQFEEAERAFFMALEDHYIRPQAHNNLGIFYLRVGRREEARQQLLLAVEAERDPAMRSVLAGRMILAMNGYNLESMLEARRKFEEALRLRPRLVPARQWLARVNQRLDDS